MTKTKETCIKCGHVANVSGCKLWACAECGRVQRTAALKSQREAESAAKKCKDCGQQIPELEVFPGPRCLGCHAKWFDRTPSAHVMPDFAGAVKRFA